MASVLMSNPPFNLKWNPPVAAGFDNRFLQYSVPPKNNANFAFILSGIALSNKSAFILPINVLNPTGVEKEIVKDLIEDNLLSAIILLPDKMFESTSIAVCILLFDKEKQTRKIEMIDLRQQYEEKERLQNGMHGGNAHEKRTYKKTVKILTDEVIKKTNDAIKMLKTEEGFCKAVDHQNVIENDYKLNPNLYIDFEELKQEYRSFKDIASDYNRIIKEKNMIKFTINETLAKTLGLYNSFNKKEIDVSPSFEVVGEAADKEQFITFSKSAILKIEVNIKESRLPETVQIFINMWKGHISYLNYEENRILAEFRDALLPKLMSGEIEV